MASSDTPCGHCTGCCLRPAREPTDCGKRGERLAASSAHLEMNVLSASGLPNCPLAAACMYQPCNGVPSKLKALAPPNSSSKKPCDKGKLDLRSLVERGSSRHEKEEWGPWVQQFHLRGGSPSFKRRELVNLEGRRSETASYASSALNRQSQSNLVLRVFCTRRAPSRGDM